MTSLTCSATQSVPAKERLGFNATETCALIGISESSLYRLEVRGLLRPVKHLRHRIYSRAEIERFLSGAPIAKGAK